MSSPRPRRSKGLVSIRMSKCKKTMVSQLISGHTHTCIGDHAADAPHFCPECQRWWNKGVEKR
jgi:hypothetical protein